MVRLIGSFMLLVLSLAVRVSAQSDKGAITGKVSDASGGILQGAEVILEPSGAHAVSDTQGQFFLNNVATGHYTVTVTYCGFSALVKEITLLRTAYFG